MTETPRSRPTPLIDGRGSIWPPEITLPIDHEAVQQIARQVKPDAVPVHVERATRLMPLSNCYWNVAHVVEESKGEIVFGWAVFWWPEVYATALHHAVWRSPEGRLVDVTEPQPGDKRAPNSVFIVDGSRPVSLEKAPSIENLFVNLCGLSCVDDYVRVHMEHCAINRDISQIFWKLGYRCENNFAKAAGLEQMTHTDIPYGTPHFTRYLWAVSAKKTNNRRYRKAIERIFRRTSGVRRPYIW